MRRPRPLRLRADISTPIAGSSPLHIDAILFAVHRGVPRTSAFLSTSTPARDLARLSGLQHPSQWIAWYDDGSNHVPLASAMRGEWKLERTEMVQRRDAEDIEALEGTVTRGTGPDRDKMLPVALRVTDSVWWDVVGFRREILSLCRNVRAVGSMLRHGYGVVRSWTCEEVDDCEPVIRDGVTQRHIPASWCASAERVQQGAVEPPYWHPARFIPRVESGARAALTQEVERGLDAIAASLER